MIHFNLLRPLSIVYSAEMFFHQSIYNDAKTELNLYGRLKQLYDQSINYSSSVIENILIYFLLCF